MFVCGILEKKKIMQHISKPHVKMERLTLSNSYNHCSGIYIIGGSFESFVALNITVNLCQTVMPIT